MPPSYSGGSWLNISPANAQNFQRLNPSKAAPAAAQAHEMEATQIVGGDEDITPGWRGTPVPPPQQTALAHVLGAKAAAKPIAQAGADAITGQETTQLDTADLPPVPARRHRRTGSPAPAAATTGQNKHANQTPADTEAYIAPTVPYDDVGTEATQIVDTSPAPAPAGRAAAFTSKQERPVDIAATVPLAATQAVEHEVDADTGTISLAATQAADEGASTLLLPATVPLSGQTQGLPATVRLPESGTGDATLAATQAVEADDQVAGGADQLSQRPALVRRAKPAMARQQPAAAAAAGPDATLLVEPDEDGAAPQTPPAESHAQTSAHRLVPKTTPRTVSQDSTTVSPRRGKMQAPPPQPDLEDDVTDEEDSNAVAEAAKGQSRPAAGLDGRSAAHGHNAAEARDDMTLSSILRAQLARHDFDRDKQQAQAEEKADRSKTNAETPADGSGQQVEGVTPSKVVRFAKASEPTGGEVAAAAQQAAAPASTASSSPAILKTAPRKGHLVVDAAAAVEAEDAGGDKGPRKVGGDSDGSTVSPAASSLVCFSSYLSLSFRWLLRFIPL